MDGGLEYDIINKWTISFDELSRIQSKSPNLRVGLLPFLKKKLEVKYFNISTFYVVLYGTKFTLDVCCSKITFIDLNNTKNLLINSSDEVYIKSLTDFKYRLIVFQSIF